MSAVKDDEFKPLRDIGDTFDLNTFSQILDMDDPPSHDFSASIVFDFFEQAEESFQQMDMALEKSDLPTLSSVGHYMRGSAHTVGMMEVRDGCERIQQYGKRVDDDGTLGLDAETCLDRIRDELHRVKDYYAIAEKGLRLFYSQFD
ncbi:signal transduction histidine kinase [Aspergillus californicus]